MPVFFVVMMLIFHPEIDSVETIVMAKQEAPSMKACNKAADNINQHPESTEVAIDGHVMKIIAVCEQEI